MVDVEEIERRLAESLGVSVPRARRGCVAPAVRKILATRGLSSEREICERPGALRELAEALVVDESFFLRDASQLDAVVDHIVTRLARGGASVRVWSAGCARGEELYSIAMLLHRRLGGVSCHDIDLLGTDMSARAIETAGLGTYSSWSLRGLEDRLLATYFEPAGRSFRLCRAVREMARFEHGTLADRCARLPAKSLDAVVFRNVAIYMTPASVDAFFDELARVLADDGLLVLAPTDPKPPRRSFTPAAAGTTTSWVRSPPGESPRASTRGSGRGDSTRDAALPATPAGDLVRCANPPVDALFSRGRQQVDQGELRDASETLRRVLYLHPEHVLARYLYVVVLRRLEAVEPAWRQQCILVRRLTEVTSHEVLEDGVTLATEVLRALDAGECSS